METVDGDTAAGGPVIVVGLLGTPGMATSIADELSADIAGELTELHPEVRWDIRTDREVQLDAPAHITQVVDVARARLLEDRLDLLVVLTDLPLQHGRRPILSHASTMHSVAVVSLPALGAVQLRGKARKAVLTMIDTLLGIPPREGLLGARHRHRMQRVRQLGTEVASEPAGVAYVARVLSGNLHLLAGMVRANEPWRLILGLQRALTAAMVGVVFAIVTSDIWRLADRVNSLRLAAVGLGSVATICATLIVGADLWERSPDRGVRQQVILFNVATTVTLVIGIAALYTTLFGVTLLATVLVVPSGLLGDVLGHPVSFADRVELAWLVSSMGTLGGALGAGLETDEGVRQAAYGSHHQGGTGSRGG